MNERFRQPLKLLILLLAVPVAYGLWKSVPHLRGLRLEFTNVDRAPLQNVTLFVNGQAYALGPLMTSAQATVKVLPRPTPSVEISFVDPDGTARRLKVTVPEVGEVGGTLAIRFDRHRIVDIELKPFPDWP